MIALIDADVIAYRFASSAETEIEWDEGIWTSHASLPEAVAKASGFMEQVMQDVGATDMLLLFSPGGKTFRHDVWPEYKANRKSKRRPLILKQLITALKDKYTHETGKNCEADDLLGIHGYRNIHTVIATIDKDLRTVEGNHYNWDKPELGIEVVDGRAAALQFYTQTLTGDAVDHFPGCPGVGKVTAAKLLADCESSEEMWEATVATYIKKGLTEGAALTQARCAYILKLEGDLTPEGVRLWTPNFA